MTAILGRASQCIKIRLLAPGKMVLNMFTHGATHLHIPEFSSPSDRGGVRPTQHVRGRTQTGTHSRSQDLFCSSRLTTSRSPGPSPQADLGCLGARVTRGNGLGPEPAHATQPVSQVFNPQLLWLPIMTHARQYLHKVPHSDLNPCFDFHLQPSEDCLSH